MNSGSFVKVVPSSEVTSGGVLWFDQPERDTVAETELHEDGFFRYLSERVAFTGLAESSFFCNRLPQAESAKTISFSSHIFFTSSTTQWFARFFKNRVFQSSFYQGTIQSVKKHLQPEYDIEGPPDEAWVAQSWSINPSECQLEINEELSDLSGQLSGLFGDLSQGIPLSRPKELIQLAEKVASQIPERNQEDIESWAEKLSSQLAKFSD